jgi:universal stress protein family protein
VTTKVVEGVPKDMIVQEANDWGADLIVLGSHGYGRVRRMVLGSVAGAVVAKAPCSVQVVRAKHLIHTLKRPPDGLGPMPTDQPNAVLPVERS